MQSKSQYHQDGWSLNAKITPSPFFHSRTIPPSLIVIHSIALPPSLPSHEDVLDLFSGTLNLSKDSYYIFLKDVRVSSHFIIDRYGFIYQTVRVNDVAWHCGYSIYQGQRGCNEFSVGIELIGHDFEPFTQDQYQSLGMLCAQLLCDWETLSLERIVGHRDIAPGRKTDPGGFDWKLFFCKLQQQLDSVRRGN